MNIELPFIINSSTEIMKWRAETFWVKEPETIKWIEKFCTLDHSPSFLLDVGANIGMYSLFAASLMRTLRIIAIEPAPNNLQYLIENVELNKFSDRIQVVSKPLASSVFQGTLSNPDQRPGATGAQVKSEFSSDPRKITTTTGDLLVAEHSVFNAILKIDVDGNELDILQGFRESLIGKRICSVLVELTEANNDEIVLFMNECGFEEDLSFRKIPGHSDFRRKESGRSERNTIFKISGGS